MAEERRKNKRMELSSRVIAKRLDTIYEGEFAIEVLDVSKTGVGFHCNSVLQIGAIYEVYLTIWTKEVIHAFVEIVRIEKEEETYLYGGIFVGMPEIDAQRITIYETIEDAK